MLGLERAGRDAKRRAFVVDGDAVRASVDRCGRENGGAFADVDGNRYLDFNLADTSMFTGYGAGAIVRAATEQMAAGSQFLLPTEDRGPCPAELGRRFGLPFWQFTLSSTQANTEAIRVARAVTGRAPC